MKVQKMKLPSQGHYLMEDAVRTIGDFSDTAEEYFQKCLDNPDSMFNPREDWRIILLHFRGESSQEIALKICREEKAVQLRLRLFLNLEELERKNSIHDQRGLINALANRARDFTSYVTNRVLLNP